MKKMVLSAVIAMLTAGCVTTQSTGELREFDLRNSNYKYVDTDTYMDLPTVQRQLYLHREACNIYFELKQDPLQVHFSTLIYGPSSATQLRDQVLFDLTAYTTGKLGIQGYTYYAKNKELARQILQVLSKPTTCPTGISAKTK